MPTKKAATAKSTRSKQKTTQPKKSASPKRRKSAAKTKSKAGDQEVTIDRRHVADRRNETEIDPTDAVASPHLERRAKVQRRRQIDPTTCERDYSEEEVEFMNAMNEYKRTSGRMFPTCSEVLEVIRELGYVKLSPAELASLRPECTESTESIDAENDLTQDEFEPEEELEAVAVNGWTI